MEVRTESRAVVAARASIVRQRKGIRALVPFLGPAFIASVAYIDPGNYATNIQSGSEFGYNLLWVVVLANLMAMLIQNMSSKLGIATGKNLPELCREHFPKWLSYVMWGFSEVAAMATDLAEFLGATLGLKSALSYPNAHCNTDYRVATYPHPDVRKVWLSPIREIHLDFGYCHRRMLCRGNVSVQTTMEPSRVPQCSPLDG